MTSKQGLWVKTKKIQSKSENLMETEDKNRMDITGVEGKQKGKVAGNGNLAFIKK